MMKGFCKNKLLPTLAKDHNSFNTRDILLLTLINNIIGHNLKKSCTDMFPIRIFKNFIT